MDNLRSYWGVADPDPQRRLRVGIIADRIEKSAALHSDANDGDELPIPYIVTDVSAVKRNTS